MNLRGGVQVQVHQSSSKSIKQDIHQFLDFSTDIF